MLEILQPQKQSDEFGKKNCRRTRNRWVKGNVAQLNWSYLMLEMSSYISYYTTLRPILQLITISATRLNLRRSPGDDCI